MKLKFPDRFPTASFFQPHKRAGQTSFDRFTAKVLSSKPGSVVLETMYTGFEIGVLIEGTGDPILIAKGLILDFKGDGAIGPYVSFPEPLTNDKVLLGYDPYYPVFLADCPAAGS